jgi:hypothetical protein
VNSGTESSSAVSPVWLLKATLTKRVAVPEAPSAISRNGRARTDAAATCEAPVACPSALRACTL